MSFSRFRQDAERDQHVADYIDGVVALVSDVTDRTAGVDVLFGIVAYGLYRQLKNYFDYQRGLQQATLRALLESEVATLVNSGWTHDDALRATLAISDNVAKIPSESRIITTGLSLLRGSH